MSDLGGGRASNGGARTGGPVPVSSDGQSGIRTPRDVMRAREAREQQRRRQQEEEELKRAAEERRKSAERRAAATVPGTAPRFSNTSSQYSPDISAQPARFDGSDERRGRGPGEVAGTNVLGDPTGRSSTSQVPIGRPRGASVSQDQPRAAPTSVGASRRAATQSAPRQPAVQPAATSRPIPASRPSEDAQKGTASSFPHAFERWEDLSSHWEGLTSFWLHRLESNTEEIKSNVPNAATLSRQITDLSAAGANLFHAVVELQRLRASSERKFQRWFFEARAGEEQQREAQAQLETNLKAERSAREEVMRQQAQAASSAEAAKREVEEARKELRIAKDEARRAWEELGRRNQDALETAQSLKEGRVALVGGVQVVPYFAQLSRTASSAHRPATIDEQRYGSAGAGSARMQSPDDERQYYRQEASPTNTDPYTDNGRQQPPLHHEVGKQSLAQGAYAPYQTGTPASAATARTAVPLGVSSQSASPEYTATQSRTESRAQQVPMDHPERFYQHASSEAYLHSPQTSAANPPATAGATMGGIQGRSDMHSEASYIGSDLEGGDLQQEHDPMISDDDDGGEEEFALDAHGNIRHDDQGRPIVFARRRRRRRRPSTAAHAATGQGPGGPGGDNGAVPGPSTASGLLPGPLSPEEDERAEYGHELAARYAEQMVLPEAPSVPATSAQAMATYPPATISATSEGPMPDYAGEGYMEGYGEGELMVGAEGAHHHPTRLSDVPEEDEERSSRRTLD